MCRFLFGVVGEAWILFTGRLEVGCYGNRETGPRGHPNALLISEDTHN